MRKSDRFGKPEPHGTRAHRLWLRSQLMKALRVPKDFAPELVVPVFTVDKRTTWTPEFKEALAAAVARDREAELQRKSARRAAYREPRSFRQPEINRKRTP